MTVISQGITMSVKEMKKYYDKADEVERAIIQHSATEVHPKSWTQPLRCIFYEERTQNKPSV